MREISFQKPLQGQLWRHKINITGSLERKQASPEVEGRIVGQE